MSATSDEPPTDSASTRTAELEARLVQLEAETTARIKHAELKVEALRAGMVDLDGLKLLNLDQVEMDASGGIKEAAAVMRELRRNKPWLFGGDNSSSPITPPAAQPPRPRFAPAMSEPEWRTARAELLRSR